MKYFDIQRWSSLERWCGRREEGWQRVQTDQGRAFGQGDPWEAQTEVRHLHISGVFCQIAIEMSLPWQHTPCCISTITNILTKRYEDKCSSQGGTLGPPLSLRQTRVALSAFIPTWQLGLKNRPIHYLMSNDHQAKGQGGDHKGKSRTRDYHAEDQVRKSFMFKFIIIDKLKIKLLWNAEDLGALTCRRLSFFFRSASTS